MSMIPANTLVLVADGRSARLFRNAGDESNLQLVQDTMLDDSAAMETGPSGNQPQEADRNEMGFAHFLAQRLNQAALKHQFDHLVVAADSTTLGELRKQFHKEVTARTIAEIAKDWTNTPTNEITAALDALRIA